MTQTVFEIDEPAISRGIKTAGIGKRGSKDLSGELAGQILADLKAGKVAAIAQGAFFAALTLKGLTGDEKLLDQAFPTGTLTDPARLAKALTSDAPEFIQQVSIRLLKGEELDRETAYQLGRFLLSDLPGDGARGIAVSALRVRYETPDEYEGLLRAMQETVEAGFQKNVPAGGPIVQFSEPFDGVDHSCLVTPLLSSHIQTKGYRAVSLTGRNSGPKFGTNLLDIANVLNAGFTKDPQSLAGEKPQWGWYINQPDISKAVDRWVELRRQTIKRPFFATLEKFLDPVKAQVIVTSAFHPPYTEKMITIAERAGFPGAIVVRNGLEGTLSFALKRAAKIMCSARQKDGSYLRHEIEFDPEQYLGITIPFEEKLEKPSASDNARLIEAFRLHGKSGNELFDHRVAVSRAGLDAALDWLQKNIYQSREAA